MGSAILGRGNCYCNADDIVLVLQRQLDYDKLSGKIAEFGNFK